NIMVAGRGVPSPDREGSAFHIGLPSLLTSGAEETRALPDDDVANRRRAGIAGFALASIDAKAVGEAARLSARVAIAAKGGAALADRLAQDGPRGGRDAPELGAAQPSRAPRGPNRGPEQDLGGVDISDSRDDPLIHQQVLDRDAPPARPERQVAGAEGVTERFGAEPAQLDCRFERARRYELQKSEAAGIVVDDTAAVVETKLDVVVGRIERFVVVGKC